MKGLSEPEMVRATNLMPRLGSAFFKERGQIPAELKADLEARSLAPRHVQAMNIIALAGRILVGDLAERLAIGRPAASQIATELESAKWVVRQPDGQDQRRIWLSLAADRKIEMERYCRRRIDPLVSVLWQMSPGDRNTFLDGLEQLALEIENLGKDTAL